MSKAYYNEIDPFAAQMLRNLIAAGHIAPGDVDTRSIEDVKPGDLTGYTQCHFFAGVGVWSLALRRAGWPDGARVWTGSCPCQPFSAAGKGNGFADERHLWPAWFHLIAQCQPPKIYGEQVASGDGLNWLDLVQTDLEAAGYATGAADLCAAGVGAPHIRQRLYFVADANHQGLEGWGGTECDSEWAHGHIAARGAVVGMADTTVGGSRTFGQASWVGTHGADGGCRGGEPLQTIPGPTNGHWVDADWIACRDGKWRPVEPGTFPLAHGAAARVGRLRAYGNAIVAQVAETFVRATL